MISFSSVMYIVTKALGKDYACTDKDCNGGKCIIENNIAKCICTDKYIGDECTTCKDIGAKFPDCIDCKDNFTKDKNNKCQPNCKDIKTCSMNGKCNPLTGKCECDKNHTGQFCELGLEWQCGDQGCYQLKSGEIGSYTSLEDCLNNYPH